MIPSKATTGIRLYDPAWTIFPGSEGGAEVLMAIGFILLSLILLRLTKNRALLWFITAVYVFGVIYFTLLCRTRAPQSTYLLTPFQTIRNAVTWGDSGIVILNRTNLYQLIANVLMFLPFGYLLPKLFRPMKHWYAVIPLGLAGSALIEVTQILTHLGCFDVDDLITNTLGAGLGYLIYRLLLRKS